jgi:hypothetical protein
LEVETDVIDNWIKTKPNIVDGKAPIHFMNASVGDNVYEVLQGAAKSLARVQCLDLTYHWFDDWGRQKRSPNALMFRVLRAW